MDNFGDLLQSFGGTEDPYTMYTGGASFDDTSSYTINDSYTLGDPSILIQTEEIGGIFDDGSGDGDVGVDGVTREFDYYLSCQNITEFSQNDKCVENYLHQYLGPRSLPLETLVPVTIIYVIIFVTGIFGNVTTCIVILTNQYMQTATNYYLFNLAMADMTTLVVG